MKNLCSGGCQFLLILDLWGISFHAVVVFGLGKDILLKSVLGHCDKFRVVLHTWTDFTHQLPPMVRCAGSVLRLDQARKNWRVIGGWGGSCFQISQPYFNQGGGGSRLCPPYYYSPHGFSDLPTALIWTGESPGAFKWAKFCLLFQMEVKLGPL